MTERDDAMPNADPTPDANIAAVCLAENARSRGAKTGLIVAEGDDALALSFRELEQEIGRAHV